MSGGALGRWRQQGEEGEEGEEGERGREREGEGRRPQRPGVRTCLRRGSLPGTPRGGALSHDATCHVIQDDQRTCA